nr:FAD-dependent monooxygenase [Kineosporia babensis]
MVVGAGPVGQTTAALLARWGLDVRLFEARTARERTGSRSISQARDVLDIWDLIGVGRRLAAEGVPWSMARTYLRDREVASLELPDQSHAVFPPFVNISQDHTEELLQAALTRLGVGTSWDHELVKISAEDDAIRATFRRGAGEIDVWGSHLVLATGASSETLRSALGVTFEGRAFTGQFLSCDIRADRPDWASERRFYIDPPWAPGAQVLIQVCPDSTFRIDWQVPEEYDLGEDERCGGLDRRIRAVLGEHPFEIVAKSTYRCQNRCADRLQAGKVLLAGDVAHLVAPFGARGLNTGVFDAENAAWKILFDVHHWAGPHLLGSYQDERHAAAREDLDVTSATLRFLVPQSPAERAERERVLRAATDPALATRIDSGRLSEPFWYPGSRLVTPDPTRPFVGRPSRGAVPDPAPGVLVPDLPVRVPGRRSVTRLREVLRGGFTVLVRDGRYSEKLYRAAVSASECPIDVVALDGVSGGEDVIKTLGMRPGEAWLIRPDAYVAAIVTEDDPDDLARCLLRALGF